MRIEPHRILLASSFLLAATSAALAENNGTVKGNKCCYDNQTGKYCGKPVNDAGQTVGTGGACECGNFVTAPGVSYSGVEFLLPVVASSLSFSVANVGDPEMLLTLALEGVPGLSITIVPGQIYGLSGVAFDSIHVSNIEESLQIDPSNANAFPVTLLVDGAPFAGEAVATLIATPGDLNLDGIVDGADMGELLALWGASSPEADLDGDGEVGAGDLGLLLANWSA